MQWQIKELKEKYEIKIKKMESNFEKILETQLSEIEQHHLKEFQSESKRQEMILKQQMDQVRFEIEKNYIPKSDHHWILTET